MDYRSIFFLSGLPEKEKDIIINKFSPPVSFSKGEIIYSKNSYSKALGFIVKGSAIAVVGGSDNVCMNSFSEGDCFGAAAVFGKEDGYVSTILSTVETQVLFVTEKELAEIFKSYPETCINYINFLSDKIRFLNSKFGLFSCGSAEDTLFKFLCSATDDNSFAQIPKNMSLLAKMLGMGRASLYRCLDALEAKGVILRENNKIKVIKNEKNS